jgi:diazepam-binding inhibitor (GABA receptor modulating acyl-CoA-binding protein)
MVKLEDRFNAAAEDVFEVSTRPDDDTMLKLYAYYKQATVGDVRGARPGFLDFRGRAKHDAWAECKGMSETAAMKAYVALVGKLRKKKR